METVHSDSRPVGAPILGASRSSWRLLEGFALVAVCLAIYWGGNHQVSLWDRDEPRYAEAARGMLASGDWIVPYFNGQARLQKPVLTYWLIALAYKVLGEGTFAARFFAGLSVAMACLVTRWLGDRMFGAPAGRIASWLFALCPLAIMLGKLSIPDGPHLFLSTVCFFCLYLTYRPRAGEDAVTRAAAFCFWICLGLTVLAKGPIVAGAVGSTMLVYKYLCGARFADFHLRWRTGLVAFAAVTLPWLIAIEHVTGSGFFQESVGRQIAGRAVHAFDGRWLPPGYYLGSIAVGFGPCLMLAILALVRLRRQWRVDGPVAFLVAWLVGPMLMLELFRSKQMHYYAMSYPAIAILAAGYLAAAMRGEIAWRRDRLTTAVSGGLWLSSFVFAVILIVGAWWLPREIAAASVLTGAGLLVASTISASLLARGKLNSMLRTQNFALACGWLAVSLVLMPGLEPVRVVRPIAEELVVEHRRTGIPVILHQLIEPSLIYYSKMEIEDYFDMEYFLEKARFSTDGLLTAVNESEYRQLSRRLPGRIEIRKSWAGWVKMHRETIHIIAVHPETGRLADRSQATRR